MKFFQRFTRSWRELSTINIDLRGSSAIIDSKEYVGIIEYGNKEEVEKYYVEDLVKQWNELFFRNNKSLIEKEVC